MNKMRIFWKMVYREIGWKIILYVFLGISIAVLSHSYGTKFDLTWQQFYINSFSYIFGFCLLEMLYHFVTYCLYISKSQPTWTIVKYSTIEPLIKLDHTNYKITSDTYSKYGFTYESGHLTRGYWYVDQYYFFAQNLWEYYKTLTLILDLRKQDEIIANDKTKDNNTRKLYGLWQQDINKALAQSKAELEMAKNILNNI